MLRILRKHGLAPEIPEDLYHLIKKAVSMRKHLEQFRKDRDGKFRLILVESRIHRLARYYKVKGSPWPSEFRVAGPRSTFCVKKPAFRQLVTKALSLAWHAIILKEHFNTCAHVLSLGTA